MVVPYDLYTFILARFWNKLFTTLDYSFSIDLIHNGIHRHEGQRRGFKFLVKNTTAVVLTRFELTASQLQGGWTRQILKLKKLFTVSKLDHFKINYLVFRFFNWQRPLLNR